MLFFRTWQVEFGPEPLSVVARLCRNKCRNDVQTRWQWRLGAASALLSTMHVPSWRYSESGTLVLLFQCGQPHIPRTIRCSLGHRDCSSCWDRRRASRRLLQ